MNDEPSHEEMKLNYQNYKEISIYYRAAVKQMVRAFIKKTPKEILIEVLKSEKIIKQDWSQKGNVFVAGVKE